MMTFADRMFYKVCLICSSIHVYIYILVSINLLFTYIYSVTWTSRMISFKAFVLTVICKCPYLCIKFLQVSNLLKLNEIHISPKIFSKFLGFLMSHTDTLYDTKLSKTCPYVIEMKPFCIAGLVEFHVFCQLLQDMEHSGPWLVVHLHLQGCLKGKLI